MCNTASWILIYNVNQKSAGESWNFEKLSLVASFCPTEPSGPPAKVNVIFDMETNSIQVTWDLPELMERNGLITHYTVMYFTESEPGDDIEVETEETNKDILNPYPNTQYIFQVRASTTAGSGPYSTEVYILTPPERKCYLINRAIEGQFMKFL